MREDKRGERSWIKVQLRDDEESREVVQHVKYWKALRSATQHITRAISIYWHLTHGDTGPLYEAFPWLQSAAPPSVQEVERTTIQKAKAALKKRERVQTAQEQDDDFFDSLGLG